MTMPERLERTASGNYSYDYRHGSQGDPEWQAFAELVAWDPVTQSEVWRQRHALPLNGGVLHTAGGLVFQGTAEGYLNAYDAASGEQLGSFAAGGAIRAAPSTVSGGGAPVHHRAGGCAFHIFDLVRIDGLQLDEGVTQPATVVGLRVGRRRTDARMGARAHLSETAGRPISNGSGGDGGSHL